MKNLRNQKGITLISLGILIVILIIITNVLAYNANDNLYITRKRSLTMDLGVLRDRVSDFYNEFGTIPASLKFNNPNAIDTLQSEGVLNNIEKNNKEDFYVLDLGVLQNLTLNYGKDFEYLRDAEAVPQSEMEKYTDLFIIHRKTHNIFYVEGVRVRVLNETGTARITRMFHTDRTADNTVIDLRYILNPAQGGARFVLVPNGYFHIGNMNVFGSERIVIATDRNATPNPANNSAHFVWQPWISTMDSTTASAYTFSGTVNDFIDGVEKYKGFWRNRDNAVIYFTAGYVAHFP